MDSWRVCWNMPDLSLIKNRRCRGFGHEVDWQWQLCEVRHAQKQRTVIAIRLTVLNPVDTRPRAIHPQHDDIARSLLEFAVGNPLGHHGVRWLKIHLANTFGKDKESFEDRIKCAHFPGT